MMVSSASELLKDGSKHLTGISEATIQSIGAVKEFTQVVRTSLGPNGMNKMVVNHLEKLFVTSDAATIIKELDVVHPAAKIAVLASQMQEQEMGDGTNFVLVLVGELLQNAEALVYTGLHPSEIIAGYTKAAQKAGEILDSLTTFTITDFKNLEQVVKAISPAISSKQYGYESTLAPLIARACIEVLPKNPQNFNVDNVRVAKILGGGVLDTQVISGHVLVRDTEGTIKHVKNAKVAVFASGVDVAKTETKDTVLLKNADDLLNYNKSEEKWIENIIKDIAESGAKVIVSGGSIGEMAMHFIERYGMMAIKVPSKFELRRICKAVGATPLVRLGKPIPEELGYCDSINSEEIGSTKVVVFRQESKDGTTHGISTLVVRASTQNILEDIERAIDDGVNVFKALVKDPRFLSGAGASEIELARRLREYADDTSQVKGLSQYAIRKYAESFEVIPRTLAENAGLKSIDFVSSLYAHHNEGKTNSGINIENGSIDDDTGIVDSIAIKSNAIRLATHAAITILQVDQIIMSKPAGGPKIPKQGPMDADD